MYFSPRDVRDRSHINTHGGLNIRKFKRLQSLILVVPWNYLTYERSQKMKPVSWGVLGVARHYQLRCALPMMHAKGVRMRAVASRDANRAAAAASTYHVETSYGSYDALLADRDVEAVYIPLPNDQHLPWIQRAADAGKHILCEKPLALNTDQVEEAINYTRAKGVLLMEAFMYRFHPQWLRAKELMLIQEIGKIRAIQSSFFYNNADPTNIRNRPEMGGGGLMDIGCYAVSVARYLTGMEPLRVMGLFDRDPSFKIDRLCSAMLEFPNGVHATFSVGTQTFSSQQVTAFGAGGTVSIPLPFNAFPDTSLSIEVTNGVRHRTISFDPTDQYQRQFEAFSYAIRHGEAAPTPIEDALANQRTLDALLRSEKSQRWEEVT